MEVNKERAKGQESVTIAASQSIGQGNAQKQRGFSSHVTTVVRKVIKQHSVKYRKEGEKEKASVKSAMKVIGLGSQARQIQKSIMRADNPQPKESIR